MTGLLLFPFRMIKSVVGEIVEISGFFSRIHVWGVFRLDPGEKRA